ncbi:alginate export family protein [Sphingosinicella terrae]|uniref:alginate export family protein n=1 Tax=Sphingosinicella terrae TaxID=2172047 RepID=UPI000E0D4406|nr:alginate export family protein [Sphingosinicella terrae]
MSDPRPRGRLRCGALAAAGALLFAAAPVAAEPAGEEQGFSIGGTFRANAEGIDGQFRPGRPESDFLLSFRTTILAQYDAGPIRLVGELSDARGYFQKRRSSAGTSEINALEPLQAYVAVDMDDAIGQGFEGAFKIGRFTMDIGSGRLVERADSSNSPSAFTGALLDLTTPDEGHLMAFWTMPNLRRPSDAESLRDNEVELDRSTDDLQFYGISYERPALLGEILGQAYAFRLTERDAPGYPTRNRDFLTFGARLYRVPATSRIDFDVEYAGQRGEIRASASDGDLRDLDVDAHYVHAELGRKLAADWSPRISAHFDLATGDGPGGDYGRFDPLFGSRRSAFGPTSLHGPITRSNLISAGLRLDGKPSARLDLAIMYRALWLEEAADSFAATGVRDPAGGSGRWAGNQVEARLRYWLVPGRLRAEAGAAWLDKGRFLREAPNAPATGDTRYAYFSLSTSF